MIVYCTDRFKNSVSKLYKIKKQYACIQEKIKTDILGAVDYQSIKGDVLKDHAGKILYKARLISCGKNGKSYGFRVYVLCDKKTNVAYCFEIYPKYGSQNKASLTKTEEKVIIKEFAKEKSDKKLKLVTWIDKEKKLKYSTPKKKKIVVKQ